MARNLDEPGANFNQLLELSIKLENARTFADASTEMEQYPDTYLRPGETLEDWTGHYFRKPNAAGGRIYGKYAQQLASGGRVGYKDGETVLPKPKPFTADMFKDKADLYLQGIFAGPNKDLFLPKIRSVLEQAVNEGSITQEEGMKFINDRILFYKNFAEENPKGTLPRWEKNEGGRVGLFTGSGDYAKKYLKYGDKATQDKFNKLVNELRINMSFESAISEALREIREGSN